ncbi:hypothetical protein ACFYKX_23570 [Cytobacillus sp. FJAT-54145]|uniref:DUF4129 domain-containing protein n=1 Tax=Cytobacillus spartinae TaxID=3299023 RepID=A0ABW6KL39_9BACI
MIRLLKVTYLQGIEILFGGVLFVVLFFSMHKPAPLAAYTILTFFASLSFTLLLHKFKEKGKIIFLVVILPIFFSVGFSFLPISLLVLLGVLIFIRTLTHYNDPERESEGKWILVTFAMGVIGLLFTISSGHTYSNQILFLLLFQLVFSITGGFIIRLLTIETGTEEKQGYTRSFISVIGILSIISVLIAGGLNIFRWIFLRVFEGIAYFVGTLASPLLIWADNLVIEYEDEKTQQENQMEPLPQQEAVRDTTTSLIDPAYIISALFFIGLIFLFIYFYKKKKAIHTTRTTKTDSFYSSTESDISINKSFGFRGKQKPPSHPIRKEIFEFEKYADKLKLGRKYYESFEDWMTRLGLENFEKINDSYEKVRYGGEEHLLADDEFKHEIKLKKRELKNLQKELMENGEIEKPIKRWKGVSKAEKRETLRTIFKNRAN